MSDMHVRLRVGGESYAFAVANVLEVVEPGDVSPVPGSGESVLGVSNLHGEVMPVFDLAAVLGISRDGAARRLLVVEHDGRHAAFAVDEVLDVGELPAHWEETDSSLLRGATLDGGELVGIVDVAGLFRALAGDSA